MVATVFTPEHAWRQVHRARSQNLRVNLFARRQQREQLDAFLSAAAPCIRFHSAPRDRVGGSRLGGLPDMPPAFAWPTYGGCDQIPMEFILQLDFADLPELPVSSGVAMPAAGLLTLFVAWEDPVLAEPAYQGHQRLAWTESSQRGQLSPAEPPSGRDPFHVYDPQPLGFRLDVSYPNPHDFFDWELDDPDFREFAAIAEGLEPHHQMLGTVHTFEGSLLDVLPSQESSEQQLAPWSEVMEVPRARADWVALLRIDSNHETGISFGDWGTHYVAIPRADLEAGDLSRVVGTSDSH